MDITVIELEDKIRKILAEDNGRVAIFEYDEDDTPEILRAEFDARQVSLKVSTFNNANKEVHVMYTTKEQHTNKAACLAEVVKYLEVIKPTLSPYTLIWAKKGEGGSSTKSYYYCNDALEVLEKFFANKKREEYVVYSLDMKGYA